MRRIRLVAAALAMAILVPASAAHAGDFPTIDGQFEGIGALTAGVPKNLTVTGRGGVPSSGVGSVALNLTVTNPSGDGFLTVWPAGQGRPNASNLNFVTGQTVPNSVLVPVGAGGQISIFSSTGAADVIVDVMGWFPIGPSFVGLSPMRLMDTRAGSTTFDGGFAGIGGLVAGGELALQIAGRSGVPASGAGSVAINVTATNPTAESFVTVWPTGLARPVASSVNFRTGQTVPNMVVVPMSADGRISLFNLAGTVDLIVDVLGWFPSSASFVGVTPARLLDSRPASPTVDGGFSGTGAVGPGGQAVVSALGRGGLPFSGVGSVALNVTVVGPTESSYVTVWPTGTVKPTASNLNFVRSQTVANFVVVPLGSGGQISLFNLAGNTDLIVDVLGWFPNGPTFTGLTPARLMDTRQSPPPPPPVVLSFRAGTHLVGSQIPAGRYVAEVAKSGCYWERQSGLGGTFDEIIANDFQPFAGRIIVDILSADVAFEFDSDCGPFTSYVSPAAVSPSIVPGAHVVGSHIAAGTYTATAMYGCYWARLRSFEGSIGTIISNDFVTTPGPIYVTISTTDAGFQTDVDCGTWTRLN